MDAFAALKAKSALRIVYDARQFWQTNRCHQTCHGARNTSLLRDMQIAFTSLSFINRRRGLHSYSNAQKVDRQ